MTNAVASPGTNLLLSSLPAKEQRRLQGLSEAVALRTNEVLYEAGRPAHYVHFPMKGCLVSVVKVLDDGKSFDAGVVGYEGLVGAEALLGANEAQFTATVRAAGGALRMRADALRAEELAGGRLSEVLRRYVQFLLVAFSQVAGCNSFHPLEKHFCSWLLTVQDRLKADQLEITHEVFARMLGVRRVGITLAARKLQQAGLIQYRWGKVTILDRKRLEVHACVCYQQHTQAYRQLLDPAWPNR